jgi:hypothetical protein
MITPANTSTTLTPDDIGVELEAQITAGKLPPVEVDAKGDPITLYMIDFPAGTTLTLLGTTSCQQFCGYHWSRTINGKDVPFGVHPSIEDPNCMGCQMAYSITSIHSHELAEAVTDPETGQVAFMGMTIGRPAAWYCDQANCGEIGDICVTMGFPAGMIAGYDVQQLWSNSQGTCVTTVPICDATTTQGCRPCTADDNGTACTGMTPVCETTSGSPKFGQCVPCVANAQCSGATPICDKSSSASLDDTCRACKASDCTGQTAICETSGSKMGRCVQCDGAHKSACTGATPLCDTTQDKCVGCLSNADCSGASPICDAKSKTCRACNANADCTAPAGICSTAAQDPALGTCVTCMADGDCGSGQACTVATHTCDTAAFSPNNSGSCGCQTPGAATPAGPASLLALALAALLSSRGAKRRGTPRRNG